MLVSKALIIDEPWISKILAGEKVWEMRSTMTAHRGPFGLIRKGSGQVVGVANLTQVSGPYDRESLEQTIRKHCVGSEIYEDPKYKWHYAWEMADVIKLSEPVNYKHKSGAVIWVSLNPEASESLKIQLHIENGETGEISRKVDAEMEKLFGGNITERKSEEATSSIANRVGETKHCTEPLENNLITNAPGDHKDSMDADSDVSIRITLTQGNINNAHFYIPRSTNLFPESAWGGKNRKEAGTPVEILFDGLSVSIQTDIDGSKRILRCRGAIGEFFRLHGPDAGDEVEIIRNDDGLYKIRVVERQN